MKIPCVTRFPLVGGINEIDMIFALLWIMCLISIPLDINTVNFEI